MQILPPTPSGFVHPRAVVALALCLIGASFAVLALGGPAGFTSAPASNSSRSDTRELLRESSIPPNPFIDMSRLLASHGLPVGTAHQVARKAASSPQQFSLLRPATTPVVSAGVAAGSSLPVRDLPAVNPFSAWRERPEERRLKNRGIDRAQAPLDSTDPVLQSAAVDAMPPVGVSFEGMNVDNSCGNCLPPDTVGAVGPNHYVQMVNSHFAIYNKTGTQLVAPKPINSIWLSAAPGTTCATHNNGD
ncbi:MAG TPA: hypothetical protein VF551_02470, partial [Chthoniobacterales bacterium]